ncbi:hypothetical protein RPALISO_201 [Ruegeria phage RpAliso]|nr:hypothetical protein RPALISO_201 [Ruegeria phage RpAliso]
MPEKQKPYAWLYKHRQDTWDEDGFIVSTQTVEMVSYKEPSRNFAPITDIRPVYLRPAKLPDDEWLRNWARENNHHCRESASIPDTATGQRKHPFTMTLFGDDLRKLIRDALLAGGEDAVA